MARNFKRPLNYKKDKEDKKDYKFSAAPTYAKLQASRPSVIDWSRTMSYIKDQGELGSCVGFSMAAMKEFQEVYERQLAQKEYGPTTPELTDLSESYIYWNAKKLDGDPNEGTSIRYAMQVLQKQGVPTEKFWPYSDKQTGQPLAGADQAASWTKIGSYWRITTLEEILTALSKQPVVIGIECFNSIFEVGKDGLVPMPSGTSAGGHAICLVGYDDTKRLLKFKNSWGTGWGQAGYGYLSYDYMPSIIDAWTCLDMTITEGEIPVTPTPTPVPDNKDDDKKKSKISPLFIGIGIAGIIFIAGVLFFVFK